MKRDTDIPTMNKPLPTDFDERLAMLLSTHGELKRMLADLFVMLWEYDSDLVQVQRHSTSVFGDEVEVLKMGRDEVVKLIEMQGTDTMIGKLKYIHQIRTLKLEGVK